MKTFIASAAALMVAGLTASVSAQVDSCAAVTAADVVSADTSAGIVGAAPKDITVSPTLAQLLLDAVCGTGRRALAEHFAGSRSLSICTFFNNCITFQTTNKNAANYIDPTRKVVITTRFNFPAGVTTGTYTTTFGFLSTTIDGPTGDYTQLSAACLIANTLNPGVCENTFAVITFPNSSKTGGDPWVEGYLGQHFYIEGPDAWYAAISTPEVQLNLKMTKFNDEAGQMYWTGAAVQHFAADGTVTQSMLIDTVDHKKAEVSCADIGATSPCIGNGGISVTLNGAKQTKPAEFETITGHKFAAANLPYECKHKTKTYIAEHPEEDAHRMLPAQDLQSFVVSRDLMDDKACDKWMTENPNVFAVDGEQSTILFSAPSMSTSLEYYKYAFEGQQYYRLDVSALNLQVEDVSIPEGIIGETLRPRHDAEGKQLMSGQVLKADTEQYIVEGPFGRDFAAKHLTEGKVFHLGGKN